MASHRYIGYVGRLAVAVGVGAAAFAVTPGTAYAETGTSADSSSTKTSESRDSQDAASDTKPDTKPGTKPDTGGDEKASEADDSGDSEDSDETGDSGETDSEESAEKPAKPSLATKLRKSAEQFEAEQVERLRAMLTPAAAAKKEPAPERDGTEQVEPVAAPEAKVAEESEDTVADGEAAPAADLVTSAAQPWRPDPFRPDDPDPDDVPAAVLALRDAILRAPIDPRIKPVIREGVELAYRISQVAPVANVPVPAYKIIPALFEAARGDKARAQLIVNQLLLTTQPVALLYYGYDQIADLLNLEYEARERKEEFYRTAWDTVDPLALLHVRGQHGLGNSVLHR